MRTAGEMPLASLRPRLRNDVVFLRVDTGIYLRSSETSCVLKGPGAYEWMSALGPRMTGESTVAELCEGLDENRQKTAMGLMSTLLKRGFARAVPAPDSETLPLAVLGRFASQVNFVEHFTHGDPGTPQELFARFRSLRVLVSGPPGEMSAAAVRGLLRNGLAEVTLNDTTWGGWFEKEISLLAESGVPARVVVCPRAGQDLADFDVVVHACDSSHTAALLELTRTMSALERPPRLFPVVADPGRVVLGPISGASVEQPCWMCAQLRLAANSDPRLAADFWRGLAIGPVGHPATAGGQVTRSMVGNAVAFEVFRLGTGQLRPDDERHAVVQDLTTLESQRERVLPHPGCPLRHAKAAPQEPLPPVDTSAAHGRAAVLVSPRFGVLSEWTDESVRQIPLKTGRVRLGPVGSLAEGPREICAFDVDTTLAARTLAVRSAVSCYVGRLGPAGPRDTVTRQDGEEVPAESLELSSGLAVPPGGPDGGWLPAVSLHGGTTRQVPTAAVYPLSPANSALLFEPTPAGAAVGWTLAEVRERGLASALARRGLVRAVDGGAPARTLADGWLAGDEEAAFVLGSVRHIGRRAQVYALPGAAPVFAVLAVVEDSGGGPADWAVGAALSARGAVRQAVLDAVGCAVRRHDDGAPADLGDPLLADFDPRLLKVAGTENGWLFDSPALPLARVLEELAGAGTQALFADTTTIDLHAVRGMVTGTVLLAAYP